MSSTEQQQQQQQTQMEIDASACATLTNCCSRDKSKWSKTVSDRRGDHKRCPVAGYTGEALDKPVFESKYSALAIAARKAASATRAAYGDHICEALPELRAVRGNIYPLAPENVKDLPFD